MITLKNKTTNQPINLTGAAVSMVYRRAGERRERLRLVIGNGIEIIEAIAGKLRVLPQILPLSVGNYIWELETRLGDNSNYVFLKGTHSITRMGVQP
jgi:hypothetical protein